MEEAAYLIALLSVVFFPPAILMWFLIHPFADRWRRVGPLRTYFVVLVVFCLIARGLYQFQEPLLRIHFGVRLPLVLLAALLFALAWYLGLRRLRRLSTATLLGLPEISRKRGPGKLVTEGIYSHIRNPRYLEGGLALAGVALFTNYLAVYVLFLLYLPVIYLVVLLEERELRSRFGADYEAYCARVPRFLPRLGRRNSDGK